MKIAIPIQADKRHCCWCYHNVPVDHFVEKRVIRFCQLFAKRLEENKRGALRLEKCKESEVRE